MINYAQSKIYKLVSNHTDAVYFGSTTNVLSQGSTLSTTLFLLYINDISAITPFSSTFCYADDTTLILSHPDIETLTHNAQHDLEALSTPSTTSLFNKNPTQSSLASFSTTA